MADHIVRKLKVGAAALAALAGAAFGQTAIASEFSYPWNSSNTSIVLDAYEYTPIDWTKMSNNKRLAGFINKASDGIAPTSRCGGNVLCRVKWRRYAATQELYNTRKVLAKTLGMKWGAYHLARPGNPIAQAEHFLSFTKPEKDDLLALDIEHNDPKKWMSLADAEIFAKHVRMRTGRYPILYTNHSTSKFIAANRDKYKLLSRLNLWYARYKPSIPGVFPMGNWNSYTIWQFSSMVNCDDKTCLRRINGAGNWIDVNVVAMSPEKLKREWPFAKLWAKKPVAKPVVPPESDLIAEAKELLPTDQPFEVAAVEAKPESSKPKSPANKPTDVTDNLVTFASFEPSVEVSVDPEAARLMWVRNPSKPNWRPGTEIRRRVTYLTSDQALNNLARSDASLKTHGISVESKRHLEKDVPTFVADQISSLQRFSTGSVKKSGAL